MLADGFALTVKFVAVFPLFWDAVTTAIVASPVGMLSLLPVTVVTPDMTLNEPLSAGALIAIPSSALCES